MNILFLIKFISSKEIRAPHFDHGIRPHHFTDLEAEINDGPKRRIADVKPSRCFSTHGDCLYKLDYWFIEIILIILNKNRSMLKII